MVTTVILDWMLVKIPGGPLRNVEAGPRQQAARQRSVPGLLRRPSRRNIEDSAVQLHDQTGGRRQVRRSSRTEERVERDGRGTDRQGETKFTVKNLMRQVSVFLFPQQSQNRQHRFSSNDGLLIQFSSNATTVRKCFFSMFL